jgi:hypothetical protein
MKIDSSRYVVAYDSKDGRVMVENLDGVDWYAAPAPPKFHKHWAQTCGWVDYLRLIERCPCGAYREGKRWDMIDKPRTKGLTKFRIRDILHL